MRFALDEHNVAHVARSSLSSSLALIVFFLSLLLFECSNLQLLRLFIFAKLFAANWSHLLPARSSLPNSDTNSFASFAAREQLFVSHCESCRLTWRQRLYLFGESYLNELTHVVVLVCLQLLALTSRASCALVAAALNAK